MATITLLEKARQGRRTALASVGQHQSYDDNVISIFDYAFDDETPQDIATDSNVIAFRTNRPALLPAPQRIAA